MYIKDDPPGNPLSKAPSPSWFLFIFQCQWNDPPSSLPLHVNVRFCAYFIRTEGAREREINIIRIRKKIKIKLRSQKNRRKKTTIKGNHRRRRWEGTWRGETSCIFFGDRRSEWIAKKDLRESRKQKKELLFYYYFFCYYKTWFWEKRRYYDDGISVPLCTGRIWCAPPRCSGSYLMLPKMQVETLNAVDEGHVAT